MKSYAVHYTFSQHFHVPAHRAYEWCTDYTPGDIKLGGEDGERRIKWLDEDTAILTDSYPAGKPTIVKRRLVRLYPEILSWTNTRISTDGMYSQFLYQITSERGGSRLTFTGNQRFVGTASTSKRKKMAKQIRKEDSTEWRVYAKEMAKDLAGKK